MKFVRSLTLVIATLTLAGCARDCARMKRSTQTGKREYLITHYSGGKVIGTYRFRGLLNNAEDSDGYYWTVNDTLYEVSGDLLIRSWK